MIGRGGSEMRVAAEAANRHRRIMAEDGEQSIGKRLHGELATAGIYPVTHNDKPITAY